MPLLKSHHTAHISKAPAIPIKHTHTHGSQAKTQLCGLKIIKIILHRCKPTCSFCRKKHPLGFAPSGCLVFIKFFYVLISPDIRSDFAFASASCPRTFPQYLFPLSSQALCKPCSGRNSKLQGRLRAWPRFRI